MQFSADTASAMPHHTAHKGYHPSEAAQALQATASALLQQACQLLEQIAELGEQEGQRILTHESTFIPGSTIGKHLRHSLDHYRLLLEAVPIASTSSSSSTNPSILHADSTSPSSSSYASGPSLPLEVNYDTRVRMLDMESNPYAALQSFREMDGRLDRVVQCTDLEKPIRLTALTPYHQELGSSFGRELWFVALHAIHHFSLLRVIAAGELGLKLPDNFGVAPSTLAFREYSKAASTSQADEQGESTENKLERRAEKMASKVKL